MIFYGSVIFSIYTYDSTVLMSVLSILWEIELVIRYLMLRWNVIRELSQWNAFQAQS